MLEFDGFDWDDGNWPKCGTHGVTKSAIEASFRSPALRLFDAQPTRYGERRWLLVAYVEARWLSVVFTRRGNLIRPISARFMHWKDVRRHVT